jgi:outer membrane protein OmpA-like peptidoglycan-associated protein
MIRRALVIATVTLFVAACATTDSTDPNAKAKRGAGIGAAAGAVVGAIIGNQTGNPATGAVVGAAAGAAIGGATGHNMDKQQQELQQIPNVEVSRPAENQIDIRLTSDILFDFDSAEIRPQSLETLRDLSNNFRQYSTERFEVDGHTDSVGSPDYNLGLSQRRADAVAAVLLDNGVPSSQISAVGYGLTRPKASNDTPEGRQLNRRVEIHVTGENAPASSGQ